jgi:hypothetical protein
MQGTTAKDIPAKWPKTTLKKLSPNKRKIKKCRSIARVQRRALFHSYDLQDLHGSEGTSCGDQDHDLVVLL